MCIISCSKHGEAVRNTWDWLMRYWRRQCTQGNITGCAVTDSQVYSVFNPLHSNISMYILHTALYTFPKVLTRRICLTIKSFFN